MRALTIVPRQPGSLRLDDIPDPQAGNRVLVKALAVGVCGTDRELIDGDYGEAPAGEDRLVLGHESLGEVVFAPPGSALSKGDRVVGIVRHPDPLPCGHCAAGEWDMCENGKYTEHGIKQRHGFASEFFALEPTMAVPVNRSLGLNAVLLEPASVLAKAWEHIEAIGRRSRWSPKRVLVTGAGPVGLMAALMGRQRGLEVHVQDHNDSGPKPRLAKDLGCKYFSGNTEDGYDILVECTGVPSVIERLLAMKTPNSVTCLTGLSAARSEVKLDVAPFNQSLVLDNRVVFGTVNANRRHYEAAAEALARADRGWLEKMLTRRTTLKTWEKTYEKQPGDVKTVLAFED